MALIKKYKFAATTEANIIRIFDPDFQKEVFYKYLEINGLDEDVVLEANQDWDALLEGLSETDRKKEMPRKLPEKYVGDVFEELNKLFIDFSSIGVWSDMEIIFEDITNTRSIIINDEEVPYTTLSILENLGYKIESAEIESEDCFVVI